MPMSQSSQGSRNPSLLHPALELERLDDCGEEAELCEEIKLTELIEDWELEKLAEELDGEFCDELALVAVLVDDRALVRELWEKAVLNDEVALVTELIAELELAMKLTDELALTTELCETKLEELEYEDDLLEEREEYAELRGGMMLDVLLVTGPPEETGATIARREFCAVAFNDEFWSSQKRTAVRREASRKALRSNERGQRPIGCECYLVEEDEYD